MKRSIWLKALVTAGALVVAGSASANRPLEQRGYDNCVDDLEVTYPRQARVMHGRFYYLSAGADDMTYYVNSTAWEQGDRVKLRTRCVTDVFGRDLVSRDTEYGRWVRGRARVRVEEVGGR